MSTISSVVSTLLGRPDAASDHARPQRAGQGNTTSDVRAPRVRIPDSGDIRQRGAKLAELGARLLPAEQSAYAAEIAREGLTNISDLIADLRRLVDDAEHYETKTGREDVSLYQRQIDAVSRSIQTIADQTSFAGTKLLAGGGGLGEIGIGAGALRGGGIHPPDEGGGTTAAQVTFADPRVGSWGFKNYPLPESGSVDLDVQVTQSAQLAGFFLSIGGDNLNLGAAIDQFVIEIEGTGGARELSFASGTQMSDVVAAINSFTNDTGVAASVSGTGIVLNSADYGGDEFVSLKVIDDGSIGTASNIGVYSFQENRSTAIDPASLRSFAGLNNPVQDFGQHVAGTINGLPTTGDGTSLRVDVFNFQYQITLTPEGAQTHDVFTALTIQRPDRSPLGGRALAGVINGEGLENAAMDRGPARELIGAALDEAGGSIASLESFGRELSRSMSEALSSAEGITGLDLEPEAARATAAFAIRAVLTDNPRGLVSALSNFSPQRTLSLLARGE